MMPATPRGPVFVHLSPHADDEAVGCPATVLALARAGWRVTNVLTSAGAEGDRRRDEAREAARAGGFGLVVAEAAVAAGSGSEYEAAVADAAVAAAGGEGTAVLISPSPHDNHPRHEAAGRAAAAAVSRLEDRAVWWMYAVWGSLPLPTLIHAFDEGMLDAAGSLLSCYTGEVARNDYHDLVRGRSVANRVLGQELVHGFGTAQSVAQPFVELFTETALVDGRWLAGRPRALDPSRPLGPVDGRDVTGWVRQASARGLIG